MIMKKINWKAISLVLALTFATTAWIQAQEPTPEPSPTPETPVPETPTPEPTPVPEPTPAPEPSPEPNPKNDTTTISWGKKKIIIVADEDGKHVRIGEKGEVLNNNDEDYRRKRRRKYYSRVGTFALDLGITNYYKDGEIGVDAAVEDLELETFRPGSHVALHFLPTTVSLFGRGAVNLKTAITIDYLNLYFVNDVQIQSDQDELTFTRTGVNYTKNKLMVRYAQIPLMLNFNTDPRSNRGVSVSVGGYAGVLWKARTKQKSDGAGKVKIEDNFNLNDFRYGLMARLDFRWFDFYVNYNISPLFEDGSSVDTQTVSLGLNLLNF